MTSPDDDALERLSNAIKLRSEFGQIFDEIALAHGSSMTFKVTVILSPPGTPYLHALKIARDGGWFDELAGRLAAVDVFGVSAEDAAPSPKLQVELQAVVRQSLGFADVDLSLKGLIKAGKRVCRIEVDDGNDTTGTGFLVGPQAIVTARHVVERLLGDDGRPVEGSETRLRVVFGDVGRVAKTVVSGVGLDWLIGSSERHELEAPGADFRKITSADPESFRDRLDYAMIRLAKPLGRSRGYYSLDKRRQPPLGDKGAQIHIYQHPMGGTMKYSVGSCISLWPERVGTRMRHDANTAGGTSGGLIVDRDFEPVAMHQCGFVDMDGETRVNGAIPTACIAAKGDPVDVVIGFDPLHRIEATGQPVIGRQQVQQLLTDMVGGQRQVLVVRGDDRSGKSFTAHILRAMLDEASHTVFEFSASEFTLDAVTSATNLMRRVIGTGSADLDIPSPGELDTTPEAWIRDVLLPAVVERLGRHAGDRLIWLVVDELNTHPLTPGSTAASFFERLLQDIRGFPFLRVLLIGQIGRPAGAAPNTLAEENISSPTNFDVEEYISRHFVASGTDKLPGDIEQLATTLVNIARSRPGYFLPELADLLVSSLKSEDRGN